MTARWLGWVLVPVLVVLAWAVGAQASSLLPSVQDTIEALADGFAEPWIVAPLWDTAQAAVGGFGLAAIAGLPLGFLLGRSPYLARMLGPLIEGAFAVPRIIVYPVLLAWLGVGLSAKLWIAAISAFFPIVLLTAAGIRDVSPTLTKLGRSLSCSPLQMARKIYLPAAAPSVMVSLRIGFSVAFIAVIIAELFAASQGLGKLVSQAYGFQQLPRMYAVVLLILFIALAGNLVLWMLERRIRSAST